MAPSSHVRYPVVFPLFASRLWCYYHLRRRVYRLCTFNQPVHHLSGIGQRTVFQNSPMEALRVSGQVQQFHFLLALGSLSCFPIFLLSSFPKSKHSGNAFPDLLRNYDDLERLVSNNISKDPISPSCCLCITVHLPVSYENSIKLGSIINVGVRAYSNALTPILYPL